MYTQFDDSARAVIYPWTPPLHPAPLDPNLLTTAQSLVDRVRKAAASCALRAELGAVVDDSECDPCAALGELTAEMRKIDLCLQQMLLVISPVAIPTTDADFTVDLEVDFVPTEIEAVLSEAA